jgi:hypothetical protein
MSSREFGTCFFEQYAQITLSALLGSEFDCLVNRDRPDLQSEGDRHLGIEVTRAMEQSKRAADELLQDVAGQTGARGDDEEWDMILASGYAYGLGGGHFIGRRELPYWSLALPLRHIIESKVSKVGNGFYGRFDHMGLFVFCKDTLREIDARSTVRYTLKLQQGLEIRYDRLFLSDADDLFVCNLDDEVPEAARMGRYSISQAQRKAFFEEALRRQQEEFPLSL